MSRVFGQDFREDVEINKMKLDVECESQAAMYYFYSTTYGEAKAEAEQAKMRLDYITAKTELDYRRNPPSDVKVTEAVIKALVDVDGEVNTALEAHAVAVQKAGGLYSTVAALEQRKSMLDNLVRLQISSYYNSADGGDAIRSALNNRG